MSGTVVLREKWPVIGRHEQAAVWLQIWTDLGRGPPTRRHREHTPEANPASWLPLEPPSLAPPLSHVQAVCLIDRPACDVRLL